jgi:hypothetical protein
MPEMGIKPNTEPIKYITMLPIKVSEQERLRS